MKLALPHPRSPATLALIAAIPSFILGLLVHASIAAMLAGFLCFTFLLTYVWGKWNSFLHKRPLYEKAFRIAVALRMAQSLMGLVSFVVLELFHTSFLEWSLTPDGLCGLVSLAVASRLAGGHFLHDPPQSPALNFHAEFATGFLGTLFQGVALSCFLLLTMALAAAILAFLRKRKKTPQDGQWMQP